MKCAIVFAALFAAGIAMAGPDMVHKDGDDVVRLSDSPCVHGGILGMLKPEHREKFRQGRAIVGGKDFYVCWLSDDNGVFMLFDDGDQGRLPLSAFKADPGI